MRPTLGCTDEEILTLPYFDLLAAADENRDMPCDIESYSLGDGIIHLVLPEGLNERAVAVYIRDRDGNYLARRVYDFTREAKIGPWLIVLDHPVLPVMYFETNVPGTYETMNEAKHKDVLCDGKMHLCVGGKKLLTYESSATLQGRGNSSWETAKAKKSYTMKLEKSRNLLGMGEFKNWNLLGNAYDLSLIKNISFNEIADRCGISYQPQMQNINLYVDGKYQGVFTLTTKIKEGKSRIPLKKGDLLYKMDPPEQEQPVRYESSTWVDDGSGYPVADLKYPSDASADELARAAAVLQGFIDKVEDPACADLADICDIESVARYYWVQEISMNFDAWGRSVYMYHKEKEGKMHMGPVWDMDLTLGRPDKKQNVSFESPEGWKVRNGGIYRTLFENVEFVRVVNDVYHNGGIREAMLEGADILERNKKAMGNDAYLNYILYGNANVRDMTIDYGSSYDEYTDNMIGFYRQRAAWIDAQMGTDAAATSP